MNDPLEQEIAALLADPQWNEHPLRRALAALDERSRDQITQFERLTSISDGFQSAVRVQSLSLNERHSKQLRQMQKIARIADRYQEMLRDSNTRLQTAATHDALTGLPNRRLIVERLTSETAAVNRSRAPFSVALLDLDHFKEVNDSFGHDIGDQLLCAVARTLLGALRDTDTCARWGGEEFLVLLPETQSAGAYVIAERLRGSVETLREEWMPETLRPTMSIGLAQHEPKTPYNATIKRADDALYRAKSQGRNRIETAQ